MDSRSVRASRFRSREVGQGLVEYALILVLVAVVSIVILSVMGGEIRSVFCKVAGTLGHPCAAADEECAINQSWSQQSAASDGIRRSFTFTAGQTVTVRAGALTAVGTGGPTFQTRIHVWNTGFDRDMTGSYSSPVTLTFTVPNDGSYNVDLHGAGANGSNWPVVFTGTVC